AGFQSSQDWVKPNIGMALAEIRELGATPQHELPGRGYFTVRNGRDVISVRAPLIDTAARHDVLSRLPDAPAPLTVLDGLPQAQQATAGGSGSGKPPVAVTADERARIIAAAQRHSRRV